jgi:hypothetical protein
MRSRDPDPGSEKPAKRLQPHRRPAQAGEVRPHSDRRADPPTARLAGLSLQRGNHVMRDRTALRTFLLPDFAPRPVRHLQEII